MKNHISCEKTFITIVSLVLITVAQFSYALDITVTKKNDTLDGTCDSDCSLREAVILANSLPGKDQIILQAGTYVLDIPAPQDIDDGIQDEDANLNGDLDITDELIIMGTTNGTTTIDGAYNDRIFEIISGSTSMSHLTLTKGRQSYYGGAIENHATLTVQYSSIISNSASAAFSPGTGGGIANFGTANIFFTTIKNNFAGAGEGHRGEGGGIYNEGNLTIRDSTIAGNSSSDDDEWSVGSGLYNEGTADIRRSLFTENHSGGYYSYGAAIMNAHGGVLKLVSSTVSNNDAGYDGGKGAIANGNPWTAPGKIYLTNVTIVDNANFGLYTRGDIYIRSSIISGNYSLENGLAQNCFREAGTFDERDSLMGEGDNPSCWTTFSFNNNKTFTTLLDALADNGGPTLTHAPRKNSVVIDGTQIGQCPMTDQRGESNYVDGDGDGIPRCDLGAVEYRP